jgi:hypothetical protein
MASNIRAARGTSTIRILPFDNVGRPCSSVSTFQLSSGDASDLPSFRDKARASLRERMIGNMGKLRKREMGWLEGHVCEVVGMEMSEFAWFKMQVSYRLL